MNYLIAFIIIKGVYLAFINYDSGLIAFFNNGNHQITQTFNGIFANPPKVIMFSHLYDMMNGVNEFTVNITAVSTTQCIFNMATTKNANVYSYQFRWAAIDDNRIEVINYFNYNFTSLTAKTFTFSHTNINALQGFVTQTSIGFNGAINYSLKIQSITYDTVVVQFTNSNGNLLSLGFQIVLGTSEAFQLSNLFSTYLDTSSHFYTSPNLTIFFGYQLQLAISGMNNNFATNLRLQKLENFNQTHAIYTFQCWSGSYLNSLSHQQIFINYLNSKLYSPFMLKTLTISPLNSLSLDSQELGVEIFNEVFTNPIVKTYLIPSLIQSLKIVVTIKCSLNKNISGYVLQCTQCTRQIQSFKQECLNKNFISFQIILFQADLINEQVELIVTSNSLTIKENVTNQFDVQNFTILGLFVNS